jgi:acyl-CoA reductase-like NAD-dependent aldehyde dehydrogenase
MEGLKQVFATPDGKTFESKKEAEDHMRRPKIHEALSTLTDGNEELVNFLIDNKDDILGTFDIGSIRRVTKGEKNKLRKSLDAIVSGGNSEHQFVIDNADAIFETFRHPKQARLEPTEKAAAIKKSLSALTDENDELADWIVTSHDKLTEAYEAGKVKRQVSSKATNGLKIYQAGKAVEAAKDASDSSLYSLEERETLVEKARTKVEAMQEVIGEDTSDERAEAVLTEFQALINA